jgi:hypothetical protein
LRQIKRPVDQRLPMPAGIAEKHPDLAILDASCRSGVLALHSARLVPLFQKAGLVQHQHCLLIAQVLDHIRAQIIAHLIGFPVRPR